VLAGYGYAPPVLGMRGGEAARLSAPRMDAKNTHGTGCTLSSAIAAGLARGLPLAEAVRAGKAYVTAAIGAADMLTIGAGIGPVHHFHAFWRADGTPRPDIAGQ